MDSDSFNRVSYNKRKKTLLQRTEEIATLCGVEASVIIYSDFEEGGGPVTWPANPRQVQGVASKLKARIDMGMSGPKVYDVDSLTEERLEKEGLKLAKLRSRSEDKETRILMSECLAGKELSSLSVVELNELDRLIGLDLNRLSYLSAEEGRSGRGKLDGNGGLGEAGSSGL